jgi:hypothetical protein
MESQLQVVKIRNLDYGIMGCSRKKLMLMEISLEILKKFQESDLPPALTMNWLSSGLLMELS